MLPAFIAGADTLRQYAGSSPVNTDNYPVVIFQGPRFIYGSQSPASERLLTVPGDLSLPDPENILTRAVTEEDFTAAYFPLVSIAYKLYPYDADASYRLFQDLERANPVRPEAGLLRQRLFAR